MEERTQEEWERLLTTNPKVMWGIVADVVKAVKAGEGERKTGRRPAVSVGSLDELYEVLFPAQYTEAAFPEAFAFVLRQRDHNQVTFAALAGFNQATVSRLLTGKTPPNVEYIERISYLLNVRPTYFSEYRALKIGQVITDILLAHPGMSAEAVRKLVTA